MAKYFSLFLDGHNFYLHFNSIVFKVLTYFHREFMIPTTMSGRMKIRSLNRFLYFSFPLSSLQIATCIQRGRL